jgi:transcriptional regulator with XRE-family HTH domain
MAPEVPAQSPEGALIQVAQKRSGLSAREAARRSGISEGRWRQVVNGYQTVSAGIHAPVTAPADTLARMAYAVEVQPDDLREAGRDDAASALQRLIELAADEMLYGDAEEAKAIEDIQKIRGATEQQKRVLIATYRAMRSERGHGKSSDGANGRHPAAG